MHPLSESDILSGQVIGELGQFHPPTPSILGDSHTVLLRLIAAILLDLWEAGTPALTIFFSAPTKEIPKNPVQGDLVVKEGDCNYQLPFG